MMQVPKLFIEHETFQTALQKKLELCKTLLPRASQKSQISSQNSANMSTTKNTDAVANQAPDGGSNEFKPRVAGSEPMTTKGVSRTEFGR